MSLKNGGPMFKREDEFRIEYESKGYSFHVPKIANRNKKDWWISILGGPDFSDIFIMDLDEFIADLNDLKERLKEKK
jgi:hypothetical protein